MTHPGPDVPGLQGDRGMSEGVTVNEGTGSREPRTDQGRWLVDHQGLVNIGKIDGSMRGDEVDLRASVRTIEDEAHDAALAEVEAAVGGQFGWTRRSDDSLDRAAVLRAIASLRRTEPS